MDSELEKMFEIDEDSPYVVELSTDTVYTESEVNQLVEIFSEKENFIKTARGKAILKGVPSDDLIQKFKDELLHKERLLLIEIDTRCDKARGMLFENVYGQIELIDEYQGMEGAREYPVTKHYRDEYGITTDISGEPQ